MPTAPDTVAPASHTTPPGRRTAILLLAGANLTLVQFVAMREFAALIGSNELVVLLVIGAYFLGLSSGYLLSRRLSRSTLLSLGFLTLALHATLPFSARWFSGTMASINLAGNTPPFLFALTLLGLAPFYAVFLPRLIDEAPPQPVDGPGAATVAAPHLRMARCYATELVGGVLGLLAILILSPARMSWIATLHLAGLVTLLGLVAPWPRLLRLTLPALPVAYFLSYPALDNASLAFHLRESLRLHHVRILASEFSPYQRVDLIEARHHRAERAVTNLYLNGNLLYGSRSLHHHNLMVSVAPNLVTPLEGRGNALVVAGGSLDNARYLAPRTRQLHVVEIDEAVTRLSRRHIQDPRGGFPTHWNLVIDDGKHFLGTWSGEPFDTICVDVPVPTHLQTAMLHSERFFALARTRLRPGGIFSISLAGRLDERKPGTPPPSRLSARILAGLLATFPHVTVARLGDHDFAWASDRPVVYDAAAVQRRIDTFCDSHPGGRAIFGQPTVKLLSDTEARELVCGTTPIGEADMQIVMRLSLAKLRNRFYDPD